MSILLSLLLAGPVLPQVDRRALDVQARAERLQPRTVASATRRPVPRAVPRAGIRPASASTSLDLSAITTICRAAGNAADPAEFLATLSRAYALSSAEGSSLRTSCAAYLAGRADARSYAPSAQ